MAVKTGDEFVIPFTIDDKATAKLKQMEVMSAAATKTFTNMGVAYEGASSKIVESSNKSSASLNKVDASSKNLSKTVSTISGNVSSFGSQIMDLPMKLLVANQALELITRTFRTFESLGTAAFGPAIQLEKGAATINAIVPQFEGAQNKFSKDIMGFQRLFGTEQQDIIEAYYNTLSSGVVNAEDASKFLNDAQKLAIGGSTDLSTSVRALTSVIAAYNMKATDAARISDILTLSERNGKATMTDLALTIGDVAPLAYNMGVSLEETSAALSAMTTAQQNAGQAMTYLRSILVGFMKQSESLKMILPQIRIDGKQFSGIQEMIKAVGLLKTMRTLVDYVGTQSESVGNLIGRQEGIQGLITLIQNSKIFDVYAKSMAEMKASAISPGQIVGQAVDIQMNTVNRKIMRLKGDLKAAISDFGYQMLGMLKITLDKLIVVIDELYGKLVALGKALAKLDWSAAIKSVIAFAAALYMCSKAAQFLVFAIRTSLAIEAIKTAIKLALVSAATLAIQAALLLLVIAIDYAVENFGEIKKVGSIVAIVFEKMWISIQEWYHKFMMFVQTSIPELIASFVEKFSDIFIKVRGFLGLNTEEFRIWADKTIASLRKPSDSIKEHEIELGNLQERTAKLNKEMSGMKFEWKHGVIAQGIKSVSEAFKDFTPNSKAARSEFDKWRLDMEKGGAPVIPGANEPPQPTIKKVPMVKMDQKQIDAIYTARDAIVGALGEIQKAYDAVGVARDKLWETRSTRGNITYGADVAAIGKAQEALEQATKKYHEEVNKLATLTQSEVIKSNEGVLDVLKKRMDVDGQIALLAKTEHTTVMFNLSNELTLVKKLIAAHKVLFEIAPENSKEEEARKQSINNLERMRLYLIDKRSKAEFDFQKNAKEIAKKQFKEDLTRRIKPATDRGGAAFDVGQLEQVGANFGKPMAMGLSSFTSFMGGPLGMVSAAGMIIDAFKAMIDTLANFPGKLVDLIKTINEAPGKWLSAAKNASVEIKKSITTLPGELVKAVTGLLRAGDMIMDSVTKGLEKAMKSNKLAKMLGENIANFMGANMFRVAAAYIRNLRMMAKALTKNMGKDFLNAFMEEFKLAIQDFFRSLNMGKFWNKIFGVPELPDMSKYASDLTASIEKSSDQLFSVIDFSAQGKGMDIADKIRNAINSSLIVTGDWFKGLWGWLEKNWWKIIDPLGIGTAIWKAIWGYTKEKWEELKAWGKGIWMGIWEWTSEKWEGVKKWGAEIWQGLLEDARENGIIAVLDPGGFGRKLYDEINKELGNGKWLTVLDPTGLSKKIYDEINKELGNGGWLRMLDPGGLGQNVYAELNRLLGNGGWLKMLDPFGLGKKTYDELNKELGNGGWLKILDPFGLGTKLYTEINNSLGSGKWLAILDPLGLGAKLYAEINKELGAGKWLKILDPFGLGAKLYTEINNSLGAGKWLAILDPFGLGAKLYTEINKELGSGKWLKILDPLGLGQSLLTELQSKLTGASLIASLDPGGFMASMLASMKTNLTLANLKTALDPGGFWTSMLASLKEKFTSAELKTIFAGIWPKLPNAFPKDFSWPDLPSLSDMEWPDLPALSITIDKPSWLSSGGIALPSNSSSYKSLMGAATGGASNIYQAVSSMFSRGGTVYAAGGTFVPKGSDTVPAMLTPGEFVMNREATRNNVGLLSFMNKTNAQVVPSVGGTTINHITINAKTMLDVETIRREVVPEIERELKKKSQMGRYVLSAAGVR